MIDANWREFKRYIVDLMRSYPSFRRSRAEMGRTTATYFRRLRRYPWQSVVDGISVATDYHPERFPTVGQLAAIIRKAGSDQDATSRRSRRREMTDLERSVATHERDQLPRDPSAQSAYVSSAETEAERLARLWEIEDISDGRQPWDDTPQVIAMARFAALEAVLRPIHDRSLGDGDQRSDTQKGGE